MTFDKPIPVSPLIALDRERCILCYRCTRFSSDVAEDGQLIARNRGAYTEIATFARGPVPRALLRERDRALPGRRADLDAVPLPGAARGRSRTCRPSAALCPAGCNIRATTREGKVKRDPVAQPPGDRRRLALRQGPLRLPAPRRRRPHASSRSPAALRAWSRSRGTTRSTAPRSCSAAPAAASSPRSPARETTEIAYGLGRAHARAALGAHSAVLPESTSAALDAFRAPLSTIGDAELVVVVGDDDGRRPRARRRPLAQAGAPERRRDRHDRRRAAHVHGRPGAAADALAELVAARERARQAAARIRAGRPDLVGPGRRRRRAPRRGRARARLRGEARLRRVPPPGHAERARRRRGVGRAADEDEVEPEGIGLLVVSGDEAAVRPGRARARRAAPTRVIAITMFHVARRRLGRPRAPGDRGARARGDDDEPRGPRPAPPPRGDRRPCPTSSPGSRSSPRASTSTLSPHAAVVFEELSGRIYGGLDLERSASGRRCPRAAPYVAPASRRRRRRAPAGASAPRRTTSSGRSGSCATGRSSPGPQVERVPELQFQRPEPRGRAVGDRRRPARDRDRRRRLAPLERHVGRAPRARRPQARRGRRARSPRSTPPTSTSTSRSCSA